MKQTDTQSRLLFLAGIVVFASFCTSLASETNSSASAAAATATPAPAAVISTDTAPVKLPYGVEDVLKLSRAQIGEEIILNYVQNSGTIYNLTPRDIVYLRDQGVSDKVVNAMLNQRKRVELAAQNAQAAQFAQNAQAIAMANAANPGDANASPAATYADQTAAVEAPLTPPASSAYVIPYSGAYYSPYYYPYYGPGYYGGWYGPTVGFGFGFGGHGGFRGGGFHGGGFHGGGHAGGHR